MKKSTKQGLLKALLIFLITVTCNTQVLAQCSMSVGGYACDPFVTITQASQFTNTNTANSCAHLSFNLSNSNCTGWTVKVRTASSSFTNGGNSVPVSYAGIRFNSATGGPGNLGYTNSYTTLSTTDQNLVTMSSANLQSPPHYHFEHLFDVQLTGSGLNLVKPNGTYQTSLIFSVYNSSNQLVGQSTMTLKFQIQYQGPNLLDECQGTQLNGGITSPIKQFTTYAELMSGVTVTDAVSVVYGLINNTTNCPNWSLKVRTGTANFANGTNYIPVNKVSLAFNTATGGPTPGAIGVSYAAIPLSTTETPLILHSGARLQAPPHGTNVTHKFNAIIQGGAHLLQPVTGAFSTTLIFTFYDHNDQLVATWQTQATINMYYGGNSSYTLALQNGASNANFHFTSPTDIASGKAINITNGLKITAYSNYQVFAQTTNANLVSASTTNTLPVSVIKVQPSLGSAISGVTCYTTPLSTNSTQPIIINTNPSFPNQIVQYNVKYFIDPNNTTISNAQSDTYTGTLIYVVVPY